VKTRLLLLLLFYSLNAYSSEYVTFEIMKKNTNSFLKTSNKIAKELSKSELQYAYGKASIDKPQAAKKNYDIVSFTLLNQHQNIFSKQINYSYKIDYTQSKSNSNDYSFSIDTGIGYNLINISKDNYISIGINFGFYNLNAVIQNDEEKLDAYKLGAKIDFSKQLFPLLSVYGSTIYSQVYTQKYDGIFNEAKIGIRVKPKSYTNFTFTAGVKYYLFSSKALKIKSLSNYLGISYSF